MGHQFRLKNMKIERATAIKIPSSTPKKMTPSVAVTARANADTLTRRNFAAVATSISDNAAAMTIAARAEFGRFASRPGTKTSITTTSAAPTSPVSWLFAPLCSATAVREPLVEIGKPLEEPGERVGGTDPDHLLARVHLLAAPRGEARRRRDRVGERHERDAQRCGEQRADVARARPKGTEAAGSPAAAMPTVATPCAVEVEQRHREPSRARR